MNAVTGRGRHTSSSTVSYRVGDGWIIDTPGVRSFGLGHVNPDNILRSFTDLAEMAEDCPRGCTHLPNSPDCAIVERVEAGELGEIGKLRARLTAAAADHPRLSAYVPEGVPFETRPRSSVAPQGTYLAP